jgi:hypothetical protein
VSAGAPVVNLSFGGYTHENTPPTALATALARYPDVVMVAAAGKNHEARKFWPAAFPQVVAVGAVDTRHAAPKRAVFSNYGPWVDVYAPGVRPEHVPEGHVETAGDQAAVDQRPRNPSRTSFAAPEVAA